MAFNKFHEKAVEIYGAKQTAVGTPATLAGANAIAALELSYKETITTESFEYSGDELSRDNQTDITDRYTETNFKTFLPVLGGGTTTALDPFIEACGGAVVTATGSLEWTNAAASNAVLTTEFRRSSQDIPTQKIYRSTDAVGTVGLELEVGKRAMLDFTFMGNHFNPTQGTALTAAYGTQKTNVSPILRANNLVTATIGARNTPGTGQNICLQKVSLPNMFGFDYQRTLLGCGDGFSKGAVSNDVQLTITEDSAGNNFDPYTLLGYEFSLVLAYGSVTGNKLEIYLNHMQLVDVQNTSVASWSGLTLSLKNRGNISIKFT